MSPEKPQQQAGVARLPKAHQFKAAMRHVIDATDHNVQVTREVNARVVAEYQALLGTDFGEKELWGVREKAMDGRGRGVGYKELTNNDLYETTRGTKWELILSMFGHDEAQLALENLLMGNFNDARNATCENAPKGEEFPSDEEVDRREAQLPRLFPVYEEAFKRAPAIAKQYLYPHLFLKGLAELDLGQDPSGVELIDMPEMMDGIAFANMSEGGALFTLVIPNKYFGEDKSGRRRIQEETRAVREGIVDGAIPINIAA